MVPVEKYATPGEGGQPDVSLVILSGDTGGNDVWIGVLGAVGRNDEDGGDYPCGVPTSYHGEEGETEI